MRVITGTARGKLLETLEGDEVVRPTADRVKEGLFSAIQFLIPGARVLDLFAGSGALGIEALSRSAAMCTFIDASRAASEVVLRNLRRTELLKNARVVTGDAFRYLEHCREPFDIVLVDPPYRKDLASAALEALDGCVTPGGVVLCETELGAEMPERCGALSLKKTYKYGKTATFQYVADPESESVEPE